jgi:predicted AlkP superfamily phosphohydrolase/phosphomutase
MYKKVDEVIGELLKLKDDDTLVIVNADHGMTSLNKEIYLNNQFFEKGFLATKRNKEGKEVIDYDNTKVVLVYPKDIYINPDGFKGEWNRPSDERYEILRNKVKNILLNLKDENGISPFEKIVEWENTKEILHLPPEGSGDLVLVMKEGFRCNQGINLNKPALFSASYNGGYKHALLAYDKKALWTPFIILGPKVKKNYKIDRPIQQIDISPTIYKLFNIRAPDYVQGKEIKEIIE